jgi:hypothetical protein
MFASICACPTGLEFPEPDYRNFNAAKELERQKSHQKQLARWLAENGYPGRLTGKVIRFPVADGHAEYMVADGSSMKLVHLPYGDGYSSREATRLTPTEIEDLVERQERLDALFTKAGSQ